MDFKLKYTQEKYKFIDDLFNEMMQMCEKVGERIHYYNPFCSFCIGRESSYKKNYIFDKDGVKKHFRKKLKVMKGIIKTIESSFKEDYVCDYDKEINIRKKIRIEKDDNSSNSEEFPGYV